jgi:hypothetical protein
VRGDPQLLQEEVVLNRIVLGAAAALVALVLGFSVSTTSTPTAQAETTDVVVIGCEFIVSAVDGDTTDTPSDADVAAACGTAPLPDTIAAGPDVQSVELLASAIGDNDTTLEASDFRGDEVDELWDANQLSTDCTAPGATFFVGAGGPGTGDFVTGFACTQTIFVFVNDEKPVTIDPPAGLVTVQDMTGIDFTCDTDASPSTLIADNDCDDGANGGLPNNGDGVVIFHLLSSATGAPSIGDVLTVRVTQEAVEQAFDINVVGPPNNIELVLAEDLIETNGSNAQAIECAEDTDVTDAISPPNATLLVATATDREDNSLARIPVFTSIDPPGDENTIVRFGLGSIPEDVTADTFFTLDPRTPDAAPVAFYQVLCGGSGTGTTDVVAEINLISGGVLSSRDESTAELTVGGAPAAIALAAVPPQIACDGSATSTVTATVTDSDGNNVADGVPVEFSVVALGTANPIDTETIDGTASSTITPLANSSAGVTVVVTAGDDSIDDVVQTSIRVDCALPIATQPSPVPTVPTGTIGGPDTGNGGYLGQSDSAGLSGWALVALAAASMVLVGGGIVARRAGK